jgi:hypothetical protein
MFDKVPLPLPIAFEEITRRDSAAFDAFYPLYEAAFPIAHEREPPQAFEAILQLNADVALQQSLGPYREWIVAIHAWAGGPLIGGHVFGAATSAAHRRCGISASVQGIYTFFHPQARGAVPIRGLVEYSQQAASHAFAPPGFEAQHPPPLIFEVNNPLRMSAPEIELDTRVSGTDPFRRYMLWRRSGFRPLDFAYVQPRLREDAQPIRYLDLFCSHGGLTALPSDMLLQHLSAFISLSVLKGVDAEQDGEFMAMKIALAARPAVAFRDPSDAAIPAIAQHVRRHSTRNQT